MAATTFSGVQESLGGGARRAPVTEGAVALAFVGLGRHRGHGGVETRRLQCGRPAAEEPSAGLHDRSGLHQARGHGLIPQRAGQKRFEDPLPGPGHDPPQLRGIDAGGEDRLGPRSENPSGGRNHAPEAFLEFFLSQRPAALGEVANHHEDFRGRPPLGTAAPVRRKTCGLEGISPRSEDAGTRLVKGRTDTRLADRQGIPLRVQVQNAADNLLPGPLRLAHVISPSRPR